MNMISNNDNKAATSLRTLERGLRLLELLAEQPNGVTVKQLGQSLDLNVSTSYHLVNTLLNRGYVSRAPDRKIQLGPTVGRLHDAYSRQLQPERDLLPILEHLSHATGETAYLETWEGGDVVIRAVLEGRQHLRVAGQIPGFRCAPHYSASGKTMLAYLGEPRLTRFLDSHQLTRRTPSTITDPGLLRKELAAITSQGHGEERGEFAEGVGCVAAPYFDAGGSVMGALSVSLPLSRIDTSRPGMVNAVLAAGEKASRALGYSGLYPPPVERQE